MSASRPTQRRWTVDEQKKLDELLEAGKTVVEIRETSGGEERK